MTDDRLQQRSSRRMRDRPARRRGSAAVSDLASSLQRGAYEARPNVLSTETIPNTLHGVGPPRAPVRRGPSLRALAGGLLVAILAAIALVLGRGA